jgi:hypothetical protein
VTATGFKEGVRSGVTVDASRSTEVDVVLEVGATRESVTVAATAAMMAMDSAEIGGTVENRQMTDLALNGRNPFYLAEVRPGVVGDQFNSFNPDTMYTSLKVNGGTGDGNAVTVDGVNYERMRGDFNGDTQLGVLNVDAIQEVEVLTSTYPAEYGRAKDAQVRFVTKSGTKDLHGTAFEFFENKDLNANLWIRNNSSQAFQNSAPPHFAYNQPGYSIGGPLVIPHKFNTDRSKLFFFFSEEWMYWRQVFTTTNTVFSPLMRQGNFSELLNPANPYFGTVRIVTDPASGAAFPNNIIPQSRLSPNGIGILNSYPLPTPGYQQSNLNVILSEPDPVNQRKDTPHFDYYLGKTVITFAGTYYWYAENTPFAASYSTTNLQTGLDRSNRQWTRPNLTGVVRATRAFTPTLVNDISFNAGADIVHINVYPEEGVEKYDRRLYGINYPYVFPVSQKVVSYRIPTVAVTGFTGEDGGTGPQHSTGPFYQVIDNLSWYVKSNHATKYGIVIEHGNQTNGEQTGSQNGSFNFLDTGSPNTTGVAVANVALGNYNQYTENGIRPFTQFISWMFEAYAQDHWKVTPKLTLEYGLRYSWQQPWYTRWNDVSDFLPAFYNPANKGIVDPVTGYITSGDPYNGIVMPGDGIPDKAKGRNNAILLPNYARLYHNLPPGYYNSYKKAFAPRLGVAYQIDTKTVFRAGAGIFHNRQDESDGELVSNAPNMPFFSNYYGSVDNPAGLTGTGLSTPFNLNAMDIYQQKYPTAFSYSASVQRELPGAIVLDTAYVAKSGYHLLHFYNANQMVAGTLTANPTVQPNALRPWEGIGSISTGSNGGHSSYDALQISMQRRFHSGLGLGLAYTWSKFIDNLTTPYNAYQFQRALDPYNFPDILNVNYIYELPVFKHSKALAGKLLGGWQVSGVTVFRSGDPLSVTDGTDMAGVGAGSGNQVWNCVGSTAYSGATGIGLPWFNKAAFTMPKSGTFGNCGYNILKGPHFDNWDMALFKGFNLAEKLRSTLRVEFFDMPNHPVLGDPGTNPRSGSFGLITTKSDSRYVQIGWKFLF